MYDSFHEMEIYAGSGGGRPVMEQTITGNICESGDILAKNRSLPEIREGDLIGVLDAGALRLLHVLHLQRAYASCRSSPHH